MKHILTVALAASLMTAPAWAGYGDYEHVKIFAQQTPHGEIPDLQAVNRDFRVAQKEDDRVKLRYVGQEHSSNVLAVEPRSNQRL